MAELVLSLGFITTVVLTVLGLTATIQKTGQESTDRINAAMVAESVVEEVVADAQTNDHDFFWDNDHLVYRAGFVEIEGTEYDWTMSAVTVKDSGADLGSSTGLTNNRLKKVDITVFWWDSQTQKSYGYGKLAFRASRLVSEAEE